MYSDDFKKLNPELFKGDGGPARNPSKFHNVRTESNGMTFQSGHEAALVAGLILLEEQKKIFGLRLQVRFPLPGGIVYVADATYMENVNGILTPKVVDAKGVRTKEYKMKRKLFKEKYGMEIEEV
jgi:hypothetical protein